MRSANKLPFSLPECPWAETGPHPNNASEGCSSIYAQWLESHIDERAPSAAEQQLEPEFASASPPSIAASAAVPPQTSSPTHAQSPESPNHQRVVEALTRSIEALKRDAESINRRIAELEALKESIAALKPKPIIWDFDSDMDTSNV